MFTKREKDMNLNKVIIFVLFYCQSNLLTTFGINLDYLGYVLAVLGLLLFLLNYKKMKLKIELWMLIAYFLMLAIRYSTGILNDSIRFSVNLILPAFLVISVPNEIKTKKQKDILHFAFISLCVFCAIESFLVIYEALTHTHVLTWIDTTYGSHLDKYQSRPIALVGSSVANSHVMAYLSFFILQLPLKNKIKYRMWAFNFFILMLLQGRMAMAFSLGFLFVYLFLQVLAKKMRVSNFVFLLIVLGGIIASLFAFGFGERIFEDDEGSAQMRFKALDYVSSLSISDFVFGTTNQMLQNVISDMDVTILEISVFNQVILYGLLFTVVFTYLTFRVFYDFRSKINRTMAIITLIFGYALMNTTNGWFSGYIVVTSLLLFNKILTPTVAKLFIPHKYLCIGNENE